MILQFGAEVIDKDNMVLGTVDHLARNLSTGEVKKFIVRREGQEMDLFLSTDDVQEATENRIKLKFSHDELSHR